MFSYIHDDERNIHVRGLYKRDFHLGFRDSALAATGGEAVVVNSKSPLS